MILLAIVSVAVTVHVRGQAQWAGARQIHGVVTGSDFVRASGNRPAAAVAARYQRAQVCADANNDGVCGTGEPTTTTDAAGAFVLADPGGWPLVADISTHATINGHAVVRHLILRAAADPRSQTVIVSPLSTEMVRMMEADGMSWATAHRKVASRIDVPVEAVTGDPAAIADARVRASVLRESVILTNRFSLAATMTDRHDMAIKDAQQAVMNLEAIPRYDHLFIITLENKATSSIVDSPFAPKINAYLKEGNQFTSYFATGNPSEPNRV
ncbi:MAG: phosphoesterase, partial [Vicinamibacterales bacterium]